MTEKKTQYQYIEIIRNTPEGRRRFTFRYNTLETTTIQSEQPINRTTQIKVPKTLEYKSIGGGKYKEHPVAGHVLHPSDNSPIHTFVFTTEGKFHHTITPDTKLYDSAKTKGLLVEDLTVKLNPETERAYAL